MWKAITYINVQTSQGDIIYSYMAYGQAQEYTNIGASLEAKFFVPDWGIKSTLTLVKVQSGIGLPMIHMLESTLES
jgi:hypothetical protein